MKIQSCKKILAVLMMFYFNVNSSMADMSPTTTYGSLVDDVGNITLPNNFRDEWTFLGTWSIAAKDVETSSSASGHGAAGLHNVYTQQGVS